jgi:hypothetical protein
MQLIILFLQQVGAQGLLLVVGHEAAKSFRAVGCIRFARPGWQVANPLLLRLALEALLFG